MTIRVLIVDDSRFMCSRIAGILEHDKDLQVIGTAGNGHEAIRKTAELVTMDVEMPVMDGIAAVGEIMRRTPVPILMFSASTHAGAQSTLKALEAGAMDFLPKQLDEIDGNRERARYLLRSRVRGLARQAAGLKVSSGASRLHHDRPDAAAPMVMPEMAATTDNETWTATAQLRLLTIVASTGGPLAIQKVLTQIPAHCPMPVLLVQHMPAKFTRSFAARLDQLCKIRVKEAEQGDRLQPGLALLAPGGMQMEISGASRKTITLREKKVSELYAPCADITLSSVARHYPGHTLTVILTGMGADGAEGALQLKRGGSMVWAQDEESCTIYGMPKAVADAQLADRVYSLDKIASELKKIN